MNIRPLLIIFIITISICCGYFVNSFYLLIFIYMTTAITIPLIIVNNRNARIPFLEGGIYSVTLPILTLDRLLFLLLGGGKGEIIHFEHFNIFWQLIKIKLFLVALFIIGGTICAIAYDFINVKKSKVI